MPDSSSDIRYKRIEKFRRRLADVAADPDVARMMQSVKSGIDSIAPISSPSTADLASMAVDCGRWSDYLAIRGSWKLLESKGLSGWDDILSSAYYQMAEFEARYRLARFQGDASPGDVMTYVGCCHSFLAAIVVGKPEFQAEYARLILRLGADGVRARSAVEKTYPMFVEAMANAVLAGKLDAKLFESNKNPFAELALAAISGRDVSANAALALDHHLGMHAEAKEARKFRDLNYFALGHALFAAPVLAVLILAGRDATSIPTDAHPMSALATFGRPHGHLPLPPQDPAPRKLLQDYPIW